MPLLFLFLLVHIVIGSGQASAGTMPKPASGDPDARQLLDQAMEAVKDEIGIKTLDRAIPLLEKAGRLDPRNHDILVELAAKEWQRGDLMPAKTDEDFDAREAIFKRGVAHAEQALEIKETAGAHFWLAVNLASSYENRNIFSKAGIFSALKKHAAWIEKNDPEYYYGGAARFWSGVVARVPDTLIKMMGEDPNRIFDAIKDAIKLEPRFLLNQLYAGRFCWRMGRKEEALQYFDHVLKADPALFPEESARNRLARDKAGEYWKEFTGKEYPER